MIIFSISCVERHFFSGCAAYGKVGGISELVHMSEEERIRYNISLDTYRTNLSVMRNEREEGREEGRKEGAMSKALEAARK